MKIKTNWYKLGLSWFKLSLSWGQGLTETLTAYCWVRFRVEDCFILRRRLISYQLILFWKAGQPVRYLNHNRAGVQIKVGNYVINFVKAKTFLKLLLRQLNFFRKHTSPCSYSLGLCGVGPVGRFFVIHTHINC